MNTNRLRAIVVAGCLGLALLLPRPGDAGDFSPAIGNYLNADTGGWGLDIQRIGNFVFVLWFTYLPDGTPVWYLAAAELDGMTLTSNIDKFTWDGSTATPTAVGTMTLVWSDEENATFSWTLNGVSGQVPVQFLTFAEGLTDVNHTGHYVAPLEQGWGASILTQGDVSAMFLYFYDQFGEPVWLLGTSVTPGMGQSFPLVYFNGPGLCPSCIARKVKVDPPTIQVALEVRFVTIRENFFEDVGIDFDFTDSDRYGTLNFVGASVDPGTPLGSNPTGAVDIPQDSGVEGLGPFQTLVPLTPDPNMLLFPERQFLEMRTKMNFDANIFAVPANCNGNLASHVEIPAQGTQGYAQPEDDSGPVEFFLPGPGSAASRIGISKVGDKSISINWQAGFSDGTVEGLNLVGRLADPGGTPDKLHIDEVTRTRSVPFLNDIPIIGFLFRRQADFAVNSELQAFLCAEVVDVAQGR